MRKTKNRKLTPLGVAGLKENAKTINAFLEFFFVNNYILKTIFSKEEGKKKDIFEEFK
jgi:hypothetical protein